MSVRSIDVDLLEHVELDPKPVGKLLDLTVGAGLLGTKLVAGEGEDGQLILCLENLICLIEWEMVARVSLTLLYLLYNSTN